MLKSILRTAAVAASFSMVSLSAGVSPVLAETLPTANEMFAKMGFGINIGNTMEVPVNPTWWGNKLDILNIMRHAYGLDDYVNNGITHIDDVGGPTGIEPRSVSARVNLGRVVRVGNRLESGGDIALFDMNGALVRRGTRSLSLENLPLGVYFAKGQGSWVKVNIR